MGIYSIQIYSSELMGGINYFCSLHNTFVSSLMPNIMIQGSKEIFRQKQNLDLF